MKAFSLKELRVERLWMLKDVVIVGDKKVG